MGNLGKIGKNWEKWEDFGKIWENFEKNYKFIEQTVIVNKTFTYESKKRCRTQYGTAHIKALQY